jgi:hypothetical protein
MISIRSFIAVYAIIDWLPFETYLLGKWPRSAWSWYRPYTCFHAFTITKTKQLTNPVSFLNVNIIIDHTKLLIIKTY